MADLALSALAIIVLCGFLAAWCWAVWQIGNELLNSRTAAQKEEPYDH